MPTGDHYNPRCGAPVVLAATALLLVALLLPQAVPEALAQGTVKVFKPREEEVSATELRSQTMQLGFGQAVVQLAERFLPCDIGPARMELLRAFLESRADVYVQSYREVDAEHTEEGFRMEMEVEVDRRALREDLESMGMAAGCVEHLRLSFDPAPDLPAEDAAGVRDMALMTGMTVTPVVMPRLTLSRVGEDLLAGELISEQGTWAASGATPGAVWLGLWGKFFDRRQALEGAGGGHTLSVEGWFTPDGVFEFDRVLQEWDQAAETPRLVAVDMEPAGVKARWSLEVLNAARLESLLDSWLAGRGLRYALTGPEPVGLPLPGDGGPP